MTFTWLDWGFVAILAMCVLMGMARGLIREGLGLVVWIVALMVARAFCVEAGNTLNGYVHIDNPLLRTVAGFVLVAFAVVIAGGFCTRVLNAIVSWVGMGSFNRVLGGLFGAAKGAAIIALIGVLIPLTPVAQMPAWQQSALRPQVVFLQNVIQTRYQHFRAQSENAGMTLPDGAGGAADEAPVRPAATIHRAPPGRAPSAEPQAGTDDPSSLATSIQAKAVDTFDHLSHSARN